MSQSQAILDTIIELEYKGEYIMYLSIISIACYIAAQLMADITSLRIVRVYGFSLDAGTFIYPLTFTLRDMVHKAVGRNGARILIITAAVMNIIMAGLFMFTAWLPPDLNVGPQTAFGAVLSPVWRIVFASIMAEIFSELLDTEVYHAWVTRVTRRYQWARVLVSNGISIPIDSLLFCWGAFGGTMPNTVVWQLIISNIFLKGAMTLLSLPLIYLQKDSNLT